MNTKKIKYLFRQTKLDDSWMYMFPTAFQQKQFINTLCFRKHLNFDWLMLEMLNFVNQFEQEQEMIQVFMIFLHPHVSQSVVASFSNSLPYIYAMIKLPEYLFVRIFNQLTWCGLELEINRSITCSIKNNKNT